MSADTGRERPVVGGHTARPPVIHDVARLAGVSHQTVSRVLNDHPNVRRTTRDRVLSAMRQLNYRPNALARGLASRRSRTIGVVSFDTRLFGPASTLLAIEQAARAAGYAVSLSSGANLDAGSVRRGVQALADQSVDGVIVIAPQEDSARGASEMHGGLPIVAVEAGYGGDVPVVSVDQFAGARLATDHLLELGHRTVWHVAGPADWLEAQERVEGWRASLAEAGLAAPPPIRGDWSPASGYRAGIELAGKSGVTAVFVANDEMALGLLHALNERGVRVPQDVSVVGFDNLPESEFFIPALTTVRQDFDELGRRGLQLLVDLMDKSPVDDRSRSRVAPSLVVRRSTARAGGGDRMPRFSAG
ncbi:LacI family DNA-binding transcriptional regulator [Rugosimonospora africana]|uniref:LacI family transcriptional regulator n=1 Tax=Rugosimonospora africana TaxID=556532 RepID=A0A8J3QPQ0_9ACTN|nr:LacI family DNA-binding transcriptional regulator [Rugosimonospora africana]GIH14763.1 LacI family transcriptional regulator [Rugosimonospora africana]